jgi:uncharacterized LabA/DUF88 family protein
MDKLETYAFIDVQNTEGTADFLGFVVDWKRLCEYLSGTYQSKKNYFYLGIEEGDTSRTQEFESLSSSTCIIKPKIFKKYKKPDKVYPVTCTNCKNEFVKRVPGRFDWKCNCDVDLTIDVIEEAGSRAIRALIFTGDGDFKPLVEKLMEDNPKSKVYLFSSPLMINGKSRLEINLRKLTNTYSTSVFFLDLNDLRRRL